MIHLFHASFSSTKYIYQVSPTGSVPGGSPTFHCVSQLQPEHLVFVEVGWRVFVLQHFMEGKSGTLWKAFIAALVLTVETLFLLRVAAFFVHWVLLCFFLFLHRLTFVVLPCWLIFTNHTLQVFNLG